MSNVKFKKSQCGNVEFKGQGALHAKAYKILVQ